ncbi:hypothetical protein DPMN_065196 [Dreissena polymorpha]|uniref:Uncharacterized protein n=1 Tax=Dreissena polymorpha TaxID=45954 RepID=A0A9D4HK41_DREPO|nr:hypothetical protein DPMN_065196 [Dreissena polymorpha]
MAVNARDGVSVINNFSKDLPIWKTHNGRREDVHTGLWSNDDTLILMESASFIRNDPFKDDILIKADMLLVSYFDCRKCYSPFCNNSSVFGLKY